MNIHELIREKSELAKTYARDGAFYTASRIFKELAHDVGEHAAYCNRMEADEIKNSNTLEAQLQARKLMEP